MLDNSMRDFKETFNRPFVDTCSRLSPLSLSIVAFVFGLLAAIALWQGLYLLGMVGWFFNRFFDGMDGTVARATDQQSEFGGYVDVILDHIVYALIPVAVTLHDATTVNIVALIFLLATFYVNSASWIYLSAILEKLGKGAKLNGEKTTVTMPGGIVGGFATILFYSAFILFPSWLAPMFWLMGLLVIVGVVQRLVWASRNI